jgi:5-methylcytosine-specific restriction endonuclease McrA
MISLGRPPQDAGNVFAVCISRVKDAALKARLESVAQAVINATAEFDNAATNNQLHQIVRDNLVGGIVTMSEMEAVYTQRMAKKGAPGRDIYDALFNSAPQGKCPLCGHRTVSTLDHHLPKAHYPALAVAPLNLVPACSDCNKAKLASLPTRASAEALHPYFDNIDSERWLHAEVAPAHPAVVRFFVVAPPGWDAVLRARVDLHFATLGLGKLYSTQAADELLNIRHQLKSLHEVGGVDLVRAELEDRAESCQLAQRNGWRTATFEAFAASDWFCDGGFV